MNIIHYNPHNDIVIAEYIDTLNMAMTDEVVSRKASTVKEIITAYNCNPVEMSSARMTNLLMKLCDEGKVTREKVKGAYRYSITDIEE